jgi:predicted hotdog family 3-hydroxylacyl-ACP dehydratase
MSNVEAPPIDELIPHAGESILLDRVVAHSPERTTARVIVGNKRWLTQPDGSVARCRVHGTVRCGA